MLIRNPLDAQDRVVATVEDLENGNYIIAFSPGKSGDYVMTVSFYGRAVQVDSFETRVCFPRLKQECDKMLSNVALNVNLRRYTTGGSRGRRRS